MSIECKECGKIFPKIIPYQHLDQHGITAKEYRKKHNSPTISEEVKKLYQKRVPHNLGKRLPDEKKEKFLKGIRNREIKYQTGELTRSRIGSKLSEETKQKIAASVSQYGKSHTLEMQNRAKKAKVTLREKNGGRIPGPMKGKKHSDNTRRKLSEVSIKRAQESCKHTNEKWQSYIKENNYILQNNIEDHTLILTCNKCQTTFTRTRQFFYQSKGAGKKCPGCFPTEYSQRRSSQEEEVFSFVKSLDSSAYQSDRSLINPLEVDIVVPNKKLGIEYCGLYWHSEITGQKSSDYHLMKKTRLKEKGYDLITIFSDEWQNKKDIVKSKIQNKLSLANNQRIFARKCEVREITTKQAKDFLNQNHISGYGKSNVKMGLFFNGRLVFVATFSKMNISRKSIGWEIARMATELNTVVVGAASKVFKKFVSIYSPEKVMSYNDLRWGEGEVYKKLGFVFDKYTSPGYWYFMSGEEKRTHRFTLRKRKNESKHQTEWQIRCSQGYDRIWDCGNSLWIWTNMDSLFECK